MPSKNVSSCQTLTLTQRKDSRQRLQMSVRLFMVYALYSLGIMVIERKPAISFALYAVALCVSHLASARKKAKQASIPSVDQESTPSNPRHFLLVDPSNLECGRPTDWSTEPYLKRLTNRTTSLSRRSRVLRWNIAD